MDFAFIVVEAVVYYYRSLLIFEMILVDEEDVLPPLSPLSEVSSLAPLSTVLAFELVLMFTSWHEFLLAKFVVVFSKAYSL